jgi:polyferredoxin
MLQSIRRISALLFTLLLTLLLLDVSGTLHGWLGWMAKVQFLPAVLALNLGIIVALLLLTLLLGRVYCSVICPLGVLQDAVARAGRRGKGKRRYCWSPALHWLRYGVLGVVVIALLTKLSMVVSLLDPYSAYGRIASTLFAPLYRWGNNLLAFFAERADSYLFYRAEVWLPSVVTLVVAALTLLVVGILAWRGGRTYCNTLCPVGTVLGWFSRFSLFKPRIDADKCNGCMVCAGKCKASCIDVKNKKIDYSRCVACMNCLGGCKQDAMHYALPSGKAAAQSIADTPKDASRRAFFTAGALFAAGTLLKAQEKKRDGGLAVIEKRLAPPRTTPILPPGAVNARRFGAQCTACQLCVSACPSRILRPSSDLQTLMQPTLCYTHGYCRPECTRCSEVCPSEAIGEITKEQKSSLQIGHAVWIRQNCVPLTDRKECGNCARHCPTGAITMVPSDADDAKSLKIPAVDAERCIGCGACEYLCPARPFTAIYVEGHEAQREI